MKYFKLEEEQVNDLLSLANEMYENPSIHPEFISNNLRPLLLPGQQSLTAKQVRWWSSNCARARITIPEWLIQILASENYQTLIKEV